MLIALGVLLGQAVAGVQTSITVANGVERSGRAGLYLAALAAVVILAIGIGILVLLLVARAPVPGATIGLSIAALAAGIWVNSLVAPFAAVPTETTSMLLGLTRWVPAILTGLAIAWCGVRTMGRGVAVGVSLLILWLGAAAITAVSAAAGTRILAKYPLEMLDYGVGVFNMAMGIPELVLPPLLVALAVGVVGFFVLRLTLSKGRGLR
jgi:hypothetical protein